MGHAYMHASRHPSSKSLPHTHRSTQQGAPQVLQLLGSVNVNNQCLHFLRCCFRTLEHRLIHTVRLSRPRCNTNLPDGTCHSLLMDGGHRHGRLWTGMRTPGNNLRRHLREHEAVMPSAL